MIHLKHIAYALEHYLCYLSSPCLPRRHLQNSPKLIFLQPRSIKFYKFIDGRADEKEPGPVVHSEIPPSYQALSTRADHNQRLPFQDPSQHNQVRAQTQKALSSRSPRRQRERRRSGHQGAMVVYGLAG